MGTSDHKHRFLGSNSLDRRTIQIISQSLRSFVHEKEHIYKFLAWTLVYMTEGRNGVEGPVKFVRTVALVTMHIHTTVVAMFPQRQPGCNREKWL